MALPGRATFYLLLKEVKYGMEETVGFCFSLFYTICIFSLPLPLIPAILKFPLSFYYKNKKIILYSQVSSNMIINIIILKIYIVANFKTRKIS